MFGAAVADSTSMGLGQTLQQLSSIVTDLQSTLTSNVFDDFFRGKLGLLCVSHELTAYCGVAVWTVVAVWWLHFVVVAVGFGS
jgi:hypothetical protein